MEKNNIKKYFKAVLIALLVCIPFSFMQSCSDDDDEKQSDFEKIITKGAWSIDHSDDIYIFNSDGTWYTYDSPDIIGNKEEESGYAGTWSYSNNTLTMKDLYEWDDEDGKWPVEEERTDVYTVTNYTNDSFLLTQIYPTKDKDRVRVFTRFK
mgnify:CR=1 FL=1